MELNALLRTRRSCRSYKPDQITEEQLTALLEAAALAPTAMGRYDRIQLRVVQDPDLLEAINADFAASIGNVNAYPTYHAPTVIFILTLREDPPALRGANAAAVVENMTLAATELGLGSVFLMGLTHELKDSAQANALLRIPAQFQMSAAMSVGYRTEAPETREPDLSRIKTVRL